MCCIRAAQLIALLPVVRLLATGTTIALTTMITPMTTISSVRVKPRRRLSRCMSVSLRLSTPLIP